MDGEVVSCLMLGQSGSVVRLKLRRGGLPQPFVISLRRVWANWPRAQQWIADSPTPTTTPRFTSPVRPNGDLFK
jgi:hypothetical protein